jgi:hypothetical protein
MVKDEPEIYLRDVLRNRLTDPNITNRPITDAYVNADWPQWTNLVLNNFPRIAIIKPNESSVSWGLGSSIFWSTYRMTIEVFVKPDQPFTISTVIYEGKELILKITRDIEEAVRTYWINDLANTNKLILLQSYSVYSPRMDYDLRLWRQVSDVTFKSVRS